MVRHVRHPARRGGSVAPMALDGPVHGPAIGDHLIIEGPDLANTGRTGGTKDPG